MAVSLGKRKRAAVPSAVKHKAARITAPEPVEEEEDDDDLRDAFRRAFEAKFKPLSDAKKAKPVKPNPATDGLELEDMRDENDMIPEDEDEDEDDNDDDDDDDSFSGLSDTEQPLAVQVVSYTDTFNEPTETDKSLRKAYMTSRPPSSTSSTPIPFSQSRSHGTSNPPSSSSAAEAEDLKNDMALQRLLSESHLLTSANTTPTGRNRHLATDLRMQSLGSKSSLSVQKNMPLSHRRGIANKAAEKEERRRREARENGIVLERAVKERKEEKRDKGVGGPGVGKMRGGTLVLSRRDVRGIEGPKPGGGGRGRGRGGRGRGGRR